METVGGKRSGEEAAFYQIRIQGHLGARWAEWFEGMTLTCLAEGDTLLAGTVRDQAALHGLLAKLRDLNLTLLSVSRSRPDQGSGQAGSQ